MKNNYIVICIVFIFNSLAYGQGLTCDQAEPFCAGNATLVFPNTFDGSFAEIGPDYGCLFDQPNPAWYYLQIGQDGDLDISISQNTQQDFLGTPLDVDFICYGPFTSTSNCSNLNAANTIGCSYSIAAVENFTITNAIVGEIYILLITNYEQDINGNHFSGFISLQQTNSADPGAGSTDCSIVSTINYCNGEIASLDGTVANAVAYSWYQNGMPLAETGPVLNNVVAPSAIYFVEKFNSSGGLIEDETFNVVFNSVPVANLATDYDLCDDSTVDGFTEFDLSTKDSEVIGFQTDVAVTYHELQAHADAGTNALPNLFTNTTINSQTVYVRIENNNNTTCYDTTTLILTVVQPPQATQPTDIVVCDDLSNDGIEIFDLTSQSAIIVGGQTGVTVTYHETPFDAISGLLPITSPYSNSLSNPQNIYARVEDDITACYVTTSFQLLVNQLPSVIVPTALNACDDNADGFENFMLTDKITEILNGQTGVSVTFYEILANAQSGTNELTMPYTNVAISETLYVRLENTSTGCYNTTTLDINVYQLPTPQAPFPIELCDDVNPGDLVEEFDLTIREFDIINGELGVSATYHETPAEAESGSNAIADPTMYASTSNLQTIFVRVTNDTTGCYKIVELDLKVNPVPSVIAVTDLIGCELNTDGLFAFDLDSKTTEVLNGQDPAIFAVTYHASPADAQAGINALLTPYTNLTNPQQIFVNILDTTTGCDISTVSFNIEVQESAIANMPLNEYVICDNIGDNDGFGQFDLTTQDAEVLGGQNPLEFTVSYYSTLVEAEAGVNPLPTTYENVSNPQVLYARVDNNTTICYQTTTLSIRVELLPIFDIDDSYVLCVDSAGGVITMVSPPVIDTGLDTVDYSFEWTDSSGVVLGTDSTFVPSTPGTYTVEATNTTTGCQNSDSTEVEQSSPPDVTATVTTLAFAEVHVIEASAIGDGEYEFSLDGGPWQQSGTFNDVMAGEHVITARDINGCGESSTAVMIMDYPLYFTPNGDGYHDTWNIIGISNQIDAKIYIFDRYGKLLKQLSPTAIGWDGSFNGEALPSSDYWFIVNYREPSDDLKKEFKAHFTLKR